MEKKNLAIIAMFLTTILTSTAQILYKFGVGNLSFDLISVITNWQIILGLALYGIGAAVMIKSLKYGNVSTLYPIIATSYIWVSIGSSVFFGEMMNLLKWVGVAVIVLGVSIISYGSKNEEIAAPIEGI
jgi:drug/metabolite transporter (DMT)-like permease